MSAFANEAVVKLKSFFSRCRKEEFEDRSDDDRCPRRCSLAAAKHENYADPNEKRRVQNDLFAPTAFNFLVPSFLFQVSDSSFRSGLLQELETRNQKQETY